MSTTTTGDAFRDTIATLLRTRYDNVRTEIHLPGKNADIVFEMRSGPRRTIVVGVECKDHQRAPNRDSVATICSEYDAAFKSEAIQDLWIVTRRTPAPGAREYADASGNVQLMTIFELEQEIIDFQPLISATIADFRNDPLSSYYILPRFETTDGAADLNAAVRAWLDSEAPLPIAIWAGYGMGKTSYARYLACTLAEAYRRDPTNPIPILIPLGELYTAPTMEGLVTRQLTAIYGVRNYSFHAFQEMSRRGRFVIILDGFDEMKHAMAVNDFNLFSNEIRKIAAIDPHVLLLGRPDAIISDDEQERLTGSKVTVSGIAMRRDDAPEFLNYRLCFLTEDEYKRLVVAQIRASARAGETVDDDQIIAALDGIDLGDLLSRPVQAKMFSELAAGDIAHIRRYSRFSLYDAFITKMLFREEGKVVRTQIASTSRRRFMRDLAWWLWTEKKTRSFTAFEIPLTLLEPHQTPGIPFDALRRELIIGSIIEERSTGRLLEEKQAGIFFFPHISFTEFLVADFLRGGSFAGAHVDRTDEALQGEVVTFLREHDPDAIRRVFDAFRAERFEIDLATLGVFLEDASCRASIAGHPSASTGWDLLWHFTSRFGLDPAAFPDDDLIRYAREAQAEIALAAILMLYYRVTERTAANDTTMAKFSLEVFRALGFDHLSGAVARDGTTSSRSVSQNHLARLIGRAIKIDNARGASRLIFNFDEFRAIYRLYCGESAMVRDWVNSVRPLYVLDSRVFTRFVLTKKEKASLTAILDRGANLRVLEVQ